MPVSNDSRTQPKRMPTDWQPLVNGYSAGFDPQVEQFVVAVYGQQGAQSAGGFTSAAARAFVDVDGPSSVQYGHFVDTRGQENRVAVAYWTDPATFERWEAARRWPAWCDRLPGTGAWREVMHVPLGRGETLLSSPLIQWGMAGARSHLVGPVREHGYWGAMRDRLPDSAHDPFTAADAEAAPANLCVICSGQDWSSCEPAHADFYRRELQPRLHKAMSDLAARGQEHGSLACRFVRMTDAAGQPIDASFGLAFFHALSDLERWAATDPLHLDIHRAFIDHKRRTQTTLRLWHEVLVLPARSWHSDYMDCHAATGPATPFGPQRPTPSSTPHPGASHAQP